MKCNGGKRFAVALVALVMMGALPGALLAQPKGQERREDRKEKAEERREDRKENAQERREDRKENAQERREDRKDNRQAWREKRRASRRAFIDKWGSIYKQPVVRAELEIHARRVARLQTMRTIAEQENKTKAVQRIDELLKREQARHEKRLAQLKGGTP